MKDCLLTAVFVAVFLTTPLVSTADEGIPVDGDRVSAELVLPGTIWFTGPRNKPSHVVEHARDFLGREIWQGDAYLAGEIFNSVNWDANFKECESIPCVGNVTGGNIWGTVRVTLDAFEGGWEAPYKFDISSRGLAFSVEGIWFAEGWGELEGYTIELHVVQDGYAFTETFWGYVYPPE